MSRDAFHSLCAVVTFIPSLWTKEQAIPGRPFGPAFWALVNRNYNAVLYSWLDHFPQTLVCNTSLDIRPGRFIDPYTSLWGPWLHHFVRAGVQVWVVWGHDVLDREACLKRIHLKSYEPHFPPLNVILESHSQHLEAKKVRHQAPFVAACFPALPSIPHDTHSYPFLPQPQFQLVQPPQPVLTLVIVGVKH